MGKGRFSKIVWSCASDEWETPDDLYESLDEEFHFTLDPCATDENHKCEKYYTEEQDGLNQDWSGEIVFVNPPYSQVYEWVEKAYNESRRVSRVLPRKDCPLCNGAGGGKGWMCGCTCRRTTVVMLLPSRTGTRWFHDYATKATEVRFIRGRLKFGGSGNSAPFDSLILIFGNV